MKFISKLFATAMVALMAASGVAQAQDMKFWRIGTGGTGGTYYPIGGLIANAISNPPGSRPCDKGGSCGVPGLVAIAVSTNASVANANAIQAGGQAGIDAETSFCTAAFGDVLNSRACSEAKQLVTEAHGPVNSAISRDTNGHAV